MAKAVRNIFPYIFPRILRLLHLASRPASPGFVTEMRAESWWGPFNRLCGCIFIVMAARLSCRGPPFPCSVQILLLLRECHCSTVVVVLENVK